MLSKSWAGAYRINERFLEQIRDTLQRCVPGQLRVLVIFDGGTRIRTDDLLTFFEHPIVRTREIEQVVIYIESHTEDHLASIILNNHADPTAQLELDSSTAVETIASTEIGRLLKDQRERYSPLAFSWSSPTGLIAVVSIWAVLTACLYPIQIQLPGAFAIAATEALPASYIVIIVKDILMPHLSFEFGRGAITTLVMQLLRKSIIILALLGLCFIIFLILWSRTW